MSGVGEAVIQVVNDDLGFVHPGGLATFLNTQARDFDLAALLQQGLTVLLIVFRISQCHWHVQAAQSAARLDAKRARVELVQGQALGGLINLVIAKVDKREDKIIEFDESDEDESNLTALNLGILKIKRNK